MEKGARMKKYGLITVLLCAFFVGAYFLYVGYSQVPITAKVLRIGETVTKKHYRSHRTSYKSYTAYHTTLRVLYEENGEEQADEIAYVYRNRWTAPRVGDQVQIATSITGRKIQYPDSGLMLTGWVMLAVSGIFLLIIWVMKRLDKPKNPYQINPDAEAEAQGLPLLETTKVVRVSAECYQWTCPVDDEFDRETYKTLLKVSGGICVFLMALPLLAGMNGGMILAMLVSCAIMMLISFGIGRKMLRGPERTQMRYRLYKDGIKIGNGKRARYILFGSITEFKAEGNRITVRTKYSRTAIFIPPEDFDVMKDYIQRRVEEEGWLGS